MAAKQTQINIRVQARGGKFLGPAVKNAQVSVWSGDNCLWTGRADGGPDPAGQRLLGGSGVINSNTNGPFTPGQSSMIVPVTSNGGSSSATPTGQYSLLPEADPVSHVRCAVAKAEFMLSKPELLDIRVVALDEIPGQQPVTASVQMWAVPGVDLTQDPGVLVILPGLVVSTKPERVGNSTMKVTATVTMMCGCPISEYNGTWPPPETGVPEPYWPASEFEVVAIGLAADGTVMYEAPLKFDTTKPANEFYGYIPLDYQATYSVYAVQRAESNVGYAPVTRPE